MAWKQTKKLCVKIISAGPAEKDPNHPPQIKHTTKALKWKYTTILNWNISLNLGKNTCWKAS